MTFSSMPYKLFYDHDKTEALEIADQLRHGESEEPKLIVVIGGDGTMLRAIRHHWQEQLPFLGINTGHLGFLLNEPGNLDFMNHELRSHHLPLLSVRVFDVLGQVREEIAFNDAWVERETGQTAWVEVSVNQCLRMPCVVADGMLVATAAGSTSYARAMGAAPLPFTAQLLTLAGSNVLKPAFWRPAVLTRDSKICLRNLDPGKRPLRAFTDGISQGTVLQLEIETHHASVELLFSPAHDPVEKLARTQFPEFHWS